MKIKTLIKSPSTWLLGIGTVAAVVPAITILAVSKVDQKDYDKTHLVLGDITYDLSKLHSGGIDTSRTVYGIKITNPTDIATTTTTFLTHIRIADLYPGVTGITDEQKNMFMDIPITKTKPAQDYFPNRNSGNPLERWKPATEKKPALTITNDKKNEYNNWLKLTFGAVQGITLSSTNGHEIMLINNRYFIGSGGILTADNIPKVEERERH